MSGFTLTDACVVAAWMDAELSEGQAARALGLDRVSARILRDKIVGRGCEAFALVNLGGTPESAHNAITAYAAQQEPRCLACGEVAVFPHQCPVTPRASAEAELAAFEARVAKDYEEMWHEPFPGFRKVK